MLWGRTNYIYRRNKKSIIKIDNKILCLYVLALLIILNHSVYYYIVSTKKLLQIMITLWVTITFIVFTGKKIHCHKSIITGLLLSYIFSTVYFLFSGAIYHLFSYGIRYFLFIPLMIVLLDSIDTKRPFLFFLILSDIIYCIALISLFFWIFATVLHIIPNSGNVATDWGEIMLNPTTKGATNFGYLYYEIQKAPSSLAHLISFRNCGIFCEGPAYAFILSLALVTEHFIRRPKSLIKIAVLWITMLTTLTTSSFLYIAFFAAVTWYISHKESRKLKTIFIPILLFLFIGLTVVLIRYKSNQSSVSIRLNDYLNAFSAFANKPIFGYGYKFDTVTVFNAGITNSFSDTLIRGGIILTSYYLIPLLCYPFRTFTKMIKKGNHISHSSDCNFVLLIWTVYVYLTNILTYTFILLTLIAYGYVLLSRREYLQN